MPKRKKIENPRESIASSAKTMQVMRAEVRIGNQELRAEVSGLRDEVRAGFDQLYRHIEGLTTMEI
jgi:hypothetical protein